MMMVIGLVDYGETCNDCDGDDGGGGCGSGAPHQAC